MDFRDFMLRLLVAQPHRFGPPQQRRVLVPPFPDTRDETGHPVAEVWPDAERLHQQIAAAEAPDDVHAALVDAFDHFIGSPNPPPAPARDDGVVPASVQRWAGWAEEAARSGKV